VNQKDLKSLTFGQKNVCKIRIKENVTTKEIKGLKRSQVPCKSMIGKISLRAPQKSARRYHPSEAQGVKV
jgi:hypothetical protein